MKRACNRSQVQGSKFKVDMAAKRHKKHKNKISGLVISICYNEQKIEILTFYESIKVNDKVGFKRILYITYNPEDQIDAD